ncbi:GalNAc(5)-diNAcBac-PP-undecaprenol beta-1,3-glucosyltransferase [Rosistilla carotiformis]|uniref:GalNAc(5)-diNAcBac-PP-undecaprenol beta-1,3-glucosyltransferase n=1 Tax=Rosistilla carotiformis TaxID=2528017 RepID=A0A518JQ13_9BACT|nr:glycosyltransferase family 2 protein [Rosistilla carotiformis]QDV67634.1 GalNAc(5)-diNAcBac-PP-undecaprenol beta-1,3-glucosyltransferase [Rosistilla carotiformis]
MTNAEITTIIPTFRRPDLLKRAVSSVQSQSYQKIKICIYDNASGDETESIATQLMNQDHRISYVKRDTNIGAINNMVEASMCVSTPLYSILNDDDILLPGFYQSAAHALNRYPSANIACARTVIVDVETMQWTLLNQPWKPGFYEPSVQNAEKMTQSHFVQTSILMRREARDIIGPFEPSGDDRIQGIIAAVAFPFVVVDVIGAAYTLHKSTISSTGGLRGGDQDDVFRHLVSITQRIMALNIPDTSKGYLLQTVANFYGDSFRQRKVDALLGRRPDGIGEEESMIPNVNWKPARLLWLLSKRGTLPKWMTKSILKASLDASERRRIKRRTKRWNALPDAVRTCLTEGDNFHSALQNMLENERP